MNPNPSDRLAELMVEELERALDEAERTELQALLARHPDWARDELEWAAAAAASTGALAQYEPMPEALQGQILGDAAQHLPAQIHRLPAQEGVAGRPAWLPWSLAAAAALAAAIGWSRSPETVVVETPAPIPAEPSPDERLAAFKAGTAQLIRWEATATEDAYAGEASGEFVWSPGRQEGFMVFEGLPANDPGQRQYQLWIFDGTRSAEHPVDGGVFDVPSSGRVVIPIQAAIEVRDPTLFAVTVEEPGGVVVSDREHIVVVGEPPT